MHDYVGAVVRNRREAVLAGVLKKMECRARENESWEFEYLIREFKVLSPGYLKIAQNYVKHRGHRSSHSRQVQHHPETRQRSLRCSLESHDQGRQTRSRHQEGNRLSI
jgi:hypothetical protein